MFDKRETVRIYCTKTELCINAHSIGFGRWTEETPIPYMQALGPCVGVGEQKIDDVGRRGLVDGPGATNACVDQYAGRR